MRLHLERGETDAAQALLDRRRSLEPDEQELLTLEGAVALAADELDLAASAAERLEAAAERLGREDLAAEANALTGRAAAPSRRPARSARPSIR